ncbi:MAG: flagellar motor switch protein FliN [Desulfobulbaceae bacterium]|nr:flagellar motor switch protein FliN [Desulfobulbaceae bacterium]
MDDAWADALEEANPEGDGAENAGGEDWDNLSDTDSSDDNGSQVASFDELSDNTADHQGSHNLDFLLDIPLSVSVELGRTEMIIDKMLQLTQGSVVELEKAAGEPVEIYVNRKLLGKGEVIVVNDRFGVRITEIISQADRIKNMG